MLTSKTCLPSYTSLVARLSMHKLYFMAGLKIIPPVYFKRPYMANNLLHSTLRQSAKYNGKTIIKSLRNLKQVLYFSYHSNN